MTDKQRDRVRRSFNLHLLDSLDCDPDTGMPTLDKTEIEPPDRLRGFNTCARHSDPRAGVHCFLDDYRIEPIWSDPERYISMLDRFYCVIAPDFSLYVDMPLPMQRYQVFRQRVIARIWQDAGLCVVPVLTWGWGESYPFAFEGIPQGGAVALSTVGLMKSEEQIELFENGAAAAMSAVRPSLVLAYGKPHAFDAMGAHVVWYESEMQARFSEMRAARAAGKEGR